MKRPRRKSAKRAQPRFEGLETRLLLTTDVEIHSVDDVFVAIRQQNVDYDLNEDDQITLEDASFLVEEVLNTRWGDFNLDGQANFADFLALTKNYGSTDAVFADGDTNGDQRVTFADFLTFAKNFGYESETPPMALKDGTAFLPNRTTFELLSHREDVPGATGIREVKFLVDLVADRIAFINAREHVYHYNFATEVWGFTGGAQAFNQATYFTDNRRYVAGSIVAHDSFERAGELGFYSIEFWPTDPVPSQHVVEVVRRIQSRMPFAVDQMAYHPAGETQRALYEREQSAYDESGIPIISTEELFGNQTFAALNPGVGFGRLRVVDGTDAIPLTSRDIVIFEHIPNDLTHVAGVITVQPQTPLSHVNLRAKQNDTPNAYIKNALSKASIERLVGKNVRFEVVNDTYSIREATLEELEEHFASIRPANPQFPVRDLSKTEIVPLASLRTSDQDAFGAKAANLGELSRILPDEQVPDGLAVPFALYDQFMMANDFYDAAADMMADPEFQSDPALRARRLAIFRSRIERGRVPNDIRAKLDQALADLRELFGPTQGFRSRSSTNNEDLIGFTGAGLYESYTHRPDEGRLENTIRQVWAGLWTFRAFEEREFWRIDHLQAAMGVAIHPNFDFEEANGVAVTKNIFDPLWEGYYINVQVGEDLVTNPGRNDVPDEILVSAIGPNREWETQYIRRSNLTGDGSAVMSDEHIAELVESMSVIQRHFRSVYNANGNRDFAMDIEFKVDIDGQLVIKQARPWVD